ncbi:MAG: ribulose-phosphate 3-epimerase [Actinomycetota bacterium]
MHNTVQIAPSILAADFARLGDAVNAVADEIQMLHVDVMDGHFVPNISLGPPVIASLRAATDLYLDCHLMITDPLRYIGSIKDAGADGVTAHIEAVPNPVPLLDEADAMGIDIGLVVNPVTPVESLMPYLDRLSMVLVMSVQPGFGGQSFIETSLPKLEALRSAIDARGLSTNVQIDGGITRDNAARARDAGANILVAGSSVFRADDPGEAVRELNAVIGV